MRGKNPLIILLLLIAFSCPKFLIASADTVDYEASTIVKNDNRTAYLERYGDFFTIYKYIADYSCNGKVYSYLLVDKDDIKTVSLDSEYTLLQISELSAEEYYFTIKPGKYEEYKQKIESDRESKPFQVNIIVLNENGEKTGFFSFSNREDANAKINALGLTTDEYEIQELWSGGAPSYVVEPKLYEGSRIVEYISDKGSVISSLELNGSTFAYNSVDSETLIRFVADKADYEKLQYSYSGKTEIKTGDTNFDGIVDVTDLTRISLVILGDEVFSTDQMKSADVDGDGMVTLADLARLQQYLSKKIESL